MPQGPLVPLYEGMPLNFIGSGLASGLSALVGAVMVFVFSWVWPICQKLQQIGVNILYIEFFFKIFDIVE